MKILNKFLFILLAPSFLSLNGMSNDKRSEGKKSEKKCLLFQAPQIQLNKLKTQCALKALELINAGKLDWTDLSELPEGLDKYIELIHTANVYFDDTNTDIIKETKSLFYELINTGSPYLKEFVAVLDDFFDYTTDSQNEKNFKLTDPFVIAYSSHEPFLIINLFLQIVLDPSNVEIIIRKHVKKYGVELIKDDQPQPKDSLIEYVAQNVINWNLLNFMNLLLKLNLFSREDLLELFRNDCSSNFSKAMFKLINNHIDLTKEEFQYMLSEEKNILFSKKNLEFYEYIFVLIENFGLNVNEIINQKTPQTGFTLLHNATMMNHIDIVKFLLANGADVKATDFKGNNALITLTNLRITMILQRALAKIMLNVTPDYNTSDYDTITEILKKLS